MSDLLAESAERLFARHDPLAETLAQGAEGHGRDDQWPPDLWAHTEEAGYPLALLTEAEGGFGFAPAEAMAAPRLAAAHAVPLPVGEAMLANRLLAAAGLEPAEGPLAFATLGAGGLVAVPFGRHLAAVVALDPEAGTLALLDTAGLPWQEGRNPAGEPRDSLAAAALSAPRAEAAAPLDTLTLRAIGATLRAEQMAGAMRTALDTTLRYAGERSQFGRTLSRFQAIQHQCAVMASQTAAAETAAAMASAALSDAFIRPDRFRLLAATAKLRAGEAAGVVAAAAHQIHGAIGFTREYALHPFTRRLWSWRDEDGTETEWGREIARTVAALPEGGLWPFLTALNEEVA